MTGDDLIGAVSMVDDDLIEEASDYRKEGKGRIVLIVSAFAASAAAIAVVNNLPGYTSDPHDFEVDNSVQTVVTTEATTAGTSDTDAVSYVSAGTGTAPFTEPETEKSSSASYPVTNEVTEAIQKTASPSSPTPSAPRRTEVYPVTEPHSVTESYLITEASPAADTSVVTETAVGETPVTEEPHPEQSPPPRPVPSPDPSVTVPERPTPMPTPMGGSVERPVSSPDPPSLLPVNRENNSYDHAVLSEKSYSKRCVYIFSEDQIGENTVLPFFFEDVSTGSGCRAVANTVKNFSSDEIFLLKCGATEGKYYVFLNDSLSAEEEDKIFKTLGITEFN